MLSALLLTACTLPGANLEPDKIYLLEWNGDLAVSPAPNTGQCPALLIISPLSASGFGASRMAYVEQTHRLDYFVSHRWADTPANMLEPLMIRALETSGLFRAVVESPAPIDTELRLETDLLHLQQVFESTPGNEVQSSRVELAVRMELYDLKDSQRIANKIFTITEPTPSADPYGGVVAANRAVAGLLRSMVDFLEASFRAGAWQC